jgi:plastocyanin
MPHVRNLARIGTRLAVVGALWFGCAALGDTRGAVAAPPSPAIDQYSPYMPYLMNPYGGMSYPMGSYGAYPMSSSAITMPAGGLAALANVSQQGPGAVRIANFAFNPPTVTVMAGQTVTWTNADTVAHTTSSDTGVWNSGPLPPGMSFSQTFPTAGTYAYHCIIHPRMTGTVTVLAGAGNAATSTFGSATVAAAGMTVTYGAGWNLVGGPTGTVLSGAIGALYTFRAGDTAYETQAVTTPLAPGNGYWAYFATPVTESLPLSNSQPAAMQLPAGHFVTIGNPSSLPMSVTGADLLLTYDATRGYQTTTILQPGQGAWAFSNNGASLTMAPAVANAGAIAGT